MSNIMRTSVSGMNSQAARLGAVSENIANSDTTGYKRSGVEFASLVLPQNGGSYTPGSVQAVVRSEISKAGPALQTGNAHNPKQLDMMISGDGFLIVGDGSGGSYLTRAGSFKMQPDGSLVNAAGYTLQGYPVGSDGTDATLNGFAGIQDVNLNTGLLSANPTTKGTLTMPLDKSFGTGAKATNTQAAAFSAAATGTTDNADKLTFTVTIDGGTSVTVSVGSATGIAGITAADIAKATNDAVGKPVATANAGILSFTATGDLTGVKSTLAVSAPTIVAANGATLGTVAGFAAVSATGVAAQDPALNQAKSPSATSTTAVSMTVYNNAGEAVKLDVYYTKVDDASNTWKMAIFDGRDAAVGTATAPFPYTTAAIATATLGFDPTTYKLTSITPGVGTTQSDNKVLGVNLASIGGGNFNLDISNTTQLFKPDESALAASVDGNPPEVVETVTIGDDGTVTAEFTSGTSRALFKIPVAKVMSPDNLIAVSGNVYQAGVESGTILIGTGGENGFGSVQAGALEGSNVDLASELTDMITAQRSYTANSKVFQTGSEILDVLVNLKR